MTQKTQNRKTDPFMTGAGMAMLFAGVLPFFYNNHDIVTFFIIASGWAIGYFINLKENQIRDKNTNKISAHNEN